MAFCDDDSILVVDDDAGSVLAMVRLLELYGWSAHGAGGVREALDLWQRHHCGLLVADIGLRDGSGFELMRELSAHGVRGICVSGYTGRHDADAARRAGFATYLPKPIEFAALLRKLTELQSRGDRRTAMGPPPQATTTTTVRPPEPQAL
jgi:CheY-like chemotaxis protein